jgi:hypothetical protein
MELWHLLHGFWISPIARYFSYLAKHPEAWGWVVFEVAVGEMFSGSLKHP